MLIETGNPDSNWQEALRLWDEICWAQTSEVEVSRKAKALLIALWNEKDWLKSEFPNRVQDIEEFVGKSKHLSVVADLANTLKHRKPNRRRSRAIQVESIWRSNLAGFRNWEIGMIQIAEKEFVAVSALLGHSIDAYMDLRADLYAMRSNKSFERRRPAAAAPLKAAFGLKHHDFC
jgi:hypothetical protein